MIEKLTVTVPFTGDELYETIKLYDILRDMDFELSETQVEVFEKLQDAEVNGGFSNGNNGQSYKSSRHMKITHLTTRTSVKLENKRCSSMEYPMKKHIKYGR